MFHLTVQSTDSRGSESSQSYSPERGGARRRRVSGRGRKARDSSESEESDVTDMNANTKTSDQGPPSQEDLQTGTERVPGLITM